ncbi:LLM class flavin-dependent oxidoreductase [Cohnella fermenti]|uniref:LLM class flavin-dependent oxidoreductase n=1 Tax=Cohnella fermenti TaxID=2565925 RepID=A0A4S4BV80_9BACL|nr:LLM class flavin-dependent oxidoreductase [Cohnella fermenti]THF76878.1 LLM class flavin-dependent oxidoreductase [Cohnella fermenti]
MTVHERRMHLNACALGLGFGPVWRLPLTQPERNGDLDYLIELARTAERGKMDALFAADFYAASDRVESSPSPHTEPLTLFAALAGATERIGLVISASTTYNESFHLANAFASLDHLSGGRAGWNMVTTAVESVHANYSRESHLEHDLRYERAERVVLEAVGMWKRWAQPLPQGRPVLVQAGSSEVGKQFASRHAEVVFTAQPVLDAAKEFYRDVKSRASALGRQPEHVLILPGLVPIVAATEAETKELERELNTFVSVESGAKRLSQMLETDLTSLHPDEPIPLEALPAVSTSDGMRSRVQLVLDLIRDQRLSVRQLVAQGTHLKMSGSTVQVADRMERWFKERAADGFNVLFPYLPGGMDSFVDRLIPELQNRGLFRTEYDGCTLRSHYGLPPVGTGSPEVTR